MKKSSLYILALVALVLLGGFYLLANRPKADTPPPPPPDNYPTITSFTATPAKSPSVGSPVTLAWTSTGATGGCTLVTYPTVSTSSTTYTDNPPPTADCSVNSSKVVSPTVSTYYTLFVYGPQIFTPTYNSASSVIYVEVPPSTPPPMPVYYDFKSDKQTYLLGENVVLNWSTSGGRNCKVYRVQLDSIVPSPQFDLSTQCTASNFLDHPQIVGKYKYAIELYNFEGYRIGNELIINVTNLPKITSFTANPNVITKAGDPVTLTWNVENSSSAKCTINNGVGDVDCSGSKVVNPTSDAFYSLTVFGITDNILISNSFVIVSVTAPPTTHDLSMKQITATPNPVIKGGKLTIKYTLKNNGSSTESNVVAKVMYGTTQVGPSALIRSLAPGASYTIPPFTVVVPTTLASKEYNLTASVTPAVGEKNITDNQQTTRVTVQ